MFRQARLVHIVFSRWQSDREPERGELDRGERLEEDPDRVEDLAHACRLLALRPVGSVEPMNG